MRTNLALASLLSAATLTLAGCSGTAVAQSDVEEQIVSQLAPDLPDAEASCPGDLEATVDETMDCTLTDPEGTEYTVKVTVTSTEGDTANFDLEIVDPE